MLTRHEPEIAATIVWSRFWAPIYGLCVRVCVCVPCCGLTMSVQCRGRIIVRCSRCTSVRWSSRSYGAWLAASDEWLALSQVDAPSLRATSNRRHLAHSALAASLSCNIIVYRTNIAAAAADAIARRMRWRSDTAEHLQSKTSSSAIAERPRGRVG